MGLLAPIPLVEWNIHFDSERAQREPRAGHQRPARGWFAAGNAPAQHRPRGGGQDREPAMVDLPDVLQIALAKQARPSMFLFNPLFMRARAMLLHFTC